MNASAISAYASQFFSGGVDPSEPHFWLIFAAVVGGLAVGAGIVWEETRRGNLWSLPTLLVILGVIIEASATVILFEFDEGISRSQQSQIVKATDRASDAEYDAGVANERAAQLESKNLALEAQIKPRDLSDDEIKRIIAKLAPFHGRSVLVQSYFGDTEGHRLLFVIAQVLFLAQLHPSLGFWYPDNSSKMQFLLGMEIDSPPEQADLADALEKAFAGTKIGVRSQWYPMPAGTPVTIHIGVKPFLMPRLTGAPKSGEQ